MVGVFVAAEVALAGVVVLAEVVEGLDLVADRRLVGLGQRPDALGRGDAAAGATWSVAMKGAGNWPIKSMRSMRRKFMRTDVCATTIAGAMRFGSPC